MKLSDFDKMTFIGKTKIDLITFETYVAENGKHFDLDRANYVWRDLHKDQHSGLITHGPWWRVRDEDDAGR